MNDQLRSEFEKVVQLISSSGLLEFYVETMQFNQYTKKYTVLSSSPLKVFSLEDLKFGFIPWLCALAVSNVAFLVEIFWSLLKILWTIIKEKLSKYWNRIIENDWRRVFERKKGLKFRN
jgi:hypothetical protein